MIPNRPKVSRKMSGTQQIIVWVIGTLILVGIAASLDHRQPAISSDIHTSESLLMALDKGEDIVGYRVNLQVFPHVKQGNVFLYESRTSLKFASFYKLNSSVGDVVTLRVATHGYIGNDRVVIFHKAE